MADIIQGEFNFEARPESARVGDANFKLSIESGNPRVSFDTGDYIEFDRSGNALNTIVGGSPVRKWEVIGEQTAASDSAGLSFSGLSADFKVFRLTALVKAYDEGFFSTSPSLRFNDDTGTNYASRRVTAHGTATVGATHGLSSVVPLIRTATEIGHIGIVATITQPVAGMPAIISAVATQWTGARTDSANFEEILTTGDWIKGEGEKISKILLLAGSFYMAGSWVLLEGLK